MSSNLRGKGRVSAWAHQSCSLLEGGGWNRCPPPSTQIRSSCVFLPKPPPRAQPGGQQVSHFLRSYKRQASSLRRWLELSQEEPKSEDREAELKVQEQLQEVRPHVVLGWALAVLPLSLACPFLAPRWNCRSSSWLQSSRPGASLSAPALPESRPCGRLCARAVAPGRPQPTSRNRLQS